MRYLRSYQYVFESARWGINILCGALCILIPIIGQMILDGYGFTIIEAKHRHGDEKSYPDFDFNDFVKYLKRGLWPFLIYFIAYMPFSLVLTVVWLVWYFGTITASGPRRGPDPVLMFGGMAIMMALSLVINYAVRVAVLPLMVQAGLSQKLDFASAWTFYKDFMKRVWVQVLVAELFFVMSAAVLGVIGYAVFCVGLYVAIPLAMLANYHLMYQLYELYLQRGGTPVPLMEEPKEMDFEEEAPPGGAPADERITGTPGGPLDARITEQPGKDLGGEG